METEALALLKRRCASCSRAWSTWRKYWSHKKVARALFRVALVHWTSRVLHRVRDAACRLRNVTRKAEDVARRMCLGSLQWQIGGFLHWRQAATHAARLMRKMWEAVSRRDSIAVAFAFTAWRQRTALNRLVTSGVDATGRNARIRAFRDWNAHAMWSLARDAKVVMGLMRVGRRRTQDAVKQWRHRTRSLLHAEHAMLRGMPHPGAWCTFYP